MALPQQQPAFRLWDCSSPGLGLLLRLCRHGGLYQGQSSEVAPASLLFTAPPITNQMSREDSKVNFV